MSTWTDAELAALARADEITIATQRADGSLRPARIVWVVRHGDGLYVRSVNGVGAAWYRGVQTRHAGRITAGGVTRDVNFTAADPEIDDALDAAYVAKYGRYVEPTRRITAPDARGTTLRIDPS